VTTPALPDYASQILADACPVCPPGDYPAVLPSRVEDTGGSLRAEYRHEVCGADWDCWWDAGASGWPLHREPARLDGAA
jgi:hypothetical protein